MPAREEKKKVRTRSNVSDKRTEHKKPRKTDWSEEKSFGRDKGKGGRSADRTSGSRGSLGEKRNSSFERRGGRPDRGSSYKPSFRPGKLEELEKRIARLEKLIGL